MSALVKSLIVALTGLLVALFVGVQLGSGSWYLPVALVLAGVGGVIYRVFARGVRLPAIVLGGLLIGYLVGNRGFAQISLLGNSPILLGEVGIAICATAFFARMAIKREPVIPKTLLSYSIVAFLFVGGARLCYDIYVRTGGSVWVALRDSATVYYAIFFFIAHRMGEIAPSRRFIESCLTVGFVLLLPAYLAQVFYPGLVYRVTLRGVPLIYHKGDLAGAMCAVGCFYIYLSTFKRRKLARLGVSIVAFWEMILASSRAAYIGWIAVVVLLVCARKARWTIAHVCSLFVGLLLLLSLNVVVGGGGTRLAAKLSDKIASLADVAGSSTSYQTDAGTLSAANNRFRSSWWKEVFNETMEKAPVTGLGFGYDLGRRFLRTYWGNAAGDPNIRSPHSIIFTVIGRMGLVGLVTFSVVMWQIVANAVRAFFFVRRGRAPTTVLAPWSGVIILLISALFGVVLEGPMGGIVFWSLLGLAVSRVPDSAPGPTTILAPKAEVRPRRERAFAPLHP